MYTYYIITHSFFIKIYVQINVRIHGRIHVYFTFVEFQWLNILQSCSFYINLLLRIVVFLTLKRFSNSKWFFTYTKIQNIRTSDLNGINKFFFSMFFVNFNLSLSSTFTYRIFQTMFLITITVVVVNIVVPTVTNLYQHFFSLKLVLAVS